MTDCALYGRVGGKFQRLGEYSEYVVSKTPQGANPVASVNSSDESAPTACAAARLFTLTKRLAGVRAGNEIKKAKYEK